jgi:hypothetical protein
VSFVAWDGALLDREIVLSSQTTMRHPITAPMRHDTASICSMTGVPWYCRQPTPLDES